MLCLHGDSKEGVLMLAHFAPGLYMLLFVTDTPKNWVIANKSLKDCKPNNRKSSVNIQVPMLIFSWTTSIRI